MVMPYVRRIVHPAPVHNVDLYDAIRCLDDANANLVSQVLLAMFVWKIIMVIMLVLMKDASLVLVVWVVLEHPAISIQVNVNANQVLAAGRKKCWLMKSDR